MVFTLKNILPQVKAPEMVRRRTVVLWLIILLITIIACVVTCIIFYNNDDDTLNTAFYFLIFVELWCVVAIYFCIALGILLCLSYIISALADF